MTISIIVPTLNEAAALPALLANPALQGGDVEIVVSDGGSTDGTVDIAKHAGVAVIQGEAGRGGQARRGAEAARGSVLLFLHADTRLAPGSLTAIRAALSDTEVVGGNFRLIFDGDDGFSTWLTGFYARIRARGLYYGDSAIFMRRSIYNALGGVRPIALMEDHDLVRRLERAGRTVCIDAPAAVTSSRRFRNRRPWRIVSQWLLMHGLFALGVSPRILARLYRSRTHAPGETRAPGHAEVNSSASSFQR